MFIPDGEMTVLAYDTPRFAPLRDLLEQLALQRRIVSWSEGYHVAVASGGAGEPAFTIWIKKNASDVAPDVYTANFCFRFDNSNSSSGFSIEALRSKLGYTTCADAGIEWLTVADSEDGAEDGAVAAAAAGAEEAEAAEAAEEAAEAVSWAELPLHNVALKITGVLYALSGGRADVSIARDDLVQPLNHLGVGNVEAALQPKRLGTHAHWFTHNGDRGNKARLQLTVGGVEIIKGIYIGDHARLGLMLATIVSTNSKALVLGGPTADPAPEPPPPQASTPPAPPPHPSTPPGAPPPSSDFAITATDEIKRALEQLDAAIANAGDVAKRLRSLVDR